MAQPHFSFGGRVRVSVTEAVALVSGFSKLILERYDFGPSASINRVTSIEVGCLVTSRMEALDMTDAEILVGRSADAPWESVPADARLEDALPDSVLYEAATLLYDHFRVPGVNHAKVSKLLHLKRRALVPPLDTTVRAVYKDAAKEAASAFPNLGRKRLYWEAIRQDLAAAEDVEAMAELRRLLLQLRDREDRRPASLSGIRLRDIILHQHQLRYAV